MAILCTKKERGEIKQVCRTMVIPTVDWW